MRRCAGGGASFRERDDVRGGDPGLDGARFVAREDLGVELEDLELWDAGDAGVEQVLGGFAEVDGAVYGSLEAQRGRAGGRGAEEDGLGAHRDHRGTGKGRLRAKKSCKK